MNKISGYQSDFAFLKEDESRIIIGYGLTQVPESEDMYEWYEVYVYKTQVNAISLEFIKEAILGDINSRTDQKILSGFVWNDVNVWLSAENQRNFSEAQRMASAIPAILPLTFKLGEDAEENPVYHTFETAEELNAFYTSAFAYINQCLNEGWQEKDSIDWSKYEEALTPPEPEPEPEPEPTPEPEPEPTPDPEPEPEPEPEPSEDEETPSVEQTDGETQEEDEQPKKKGK